MFMKGMNIFLIILLVIFIQCLKNYFDLYSLKILKEKKINVSKIKEVEKIFVKIRFSYNVIILIIT